MATNARKVRDLANPEQRKKMKKSTTNIKERIQELNDKLVTNSCHDDMVYHIDELDELLEGKNISEILDMAFFGKYNPSDEYFRFDGYGNLLTMDEGQVTKYMELFDDLEEE